MVTDTLFSSHSASQHFSKLDQTIINLITQQAFLKLTSNTAYLNVLNYCLSRTEQLHHIHIVIIDHKTIQDNRARQLDHNLNVPNSNDIKINDLRFKESYFSCTPQQFEQACDLSNDQLIHLNKSLDQVQTSVLTVEGILNKIIAKGWLIKRPSPINDNSDEYCLNHDAQSSVAIEANYQLDFVQLQHDLQTIGYDLMILNHPINNEVKSD